MSLSLNISNNQLKLQHQRLPSRFRHFADERYVKLLTIGEGLFSGDRLHTQLSVRDSEMTFASESAQKIYGEAGKDSAKQSLHLRLENAQVALLNDELLLYQQATFAGLTRIEMDSASTLFFADLINKGRSFEDFDFSRYFNHVTVSVDGAVEYAERYCLSGSEMKARFAFYGLPRPVVARVLIKPPPTMSPNDYLAHLHALGFAEAALSAHGKLLIVTLISDNEHQQKQQITALWRDWRQQQSLPALDLGKY